ncbi:hypothetical protein IYY11_21070 [Methylocystis sp. H62]|uniref:hypothetical protein n=1 Tax=Methylocystis sp. H62 TaxID=2785789 RepID=UPI0018C34569|nr:hypothetical protein [Methylocystis sp. H62]MBG0795855.1 hypothetical protein [Methylocystis sp. H62]
MSHLQPRPEPSDALVPWSDEDIGRAVLVYARVRDEGRRAAARCEVWRVLARSVWRESVAGETLRQRRNARLTLSLTH